MAKVSIVGAYNSPFGAFVKKNKETKEITDLKPLHDLLIEAARGAVEDAKIDPADIDAIWIGSFTPGLLADQDHLGPIALEAFPEAFRFKPTQRVEGACASSSMALYNAVYGIESGRYKNVLVVGVEKMNTRNTKAVTHALATASHWPDEGAEGMTFPGLFAEYAKGYKDHYHLSDQQLREMLASVSALMYKNGLENPLAHFSKGSPADKLQLITKEAVLNLPDEKNPMIAEPLRLHDCSLITDGAAAVVLTSSDNAKANYPHAVELSGIGHTSERLPIANRENMHELIAAKKAKEQAFEEAGVSTEDIQIAEVHDCFTINQLLCTEALGFSEDGRAGFDYLEGRFGADDDRVSVNLSGGLKAKGHPVGATGVSMHVLLHKQLIGDPIGVRSPRAPEIAATLNVGGSAATNAVTVLKRIK
ncbi:MAG: thiolase C-terminal domain-containing protein [Alkalispirochaeta sp.]